MKGLSAKGNRDKDYFVTDGEVAKGCRRPAPDAEWKLVVARARYGGLRCPSEVLAFSVRGDVDWKRLRITVDSPKTEHHEGKAERLMPLFPELRPYLKKVRAELLVDFHPEKAATERAAGNPAMAISRGELMDTAALIITTAGLVPWPKAFVADAQAPGRRSCERITPIRRQRLARPQPACCRAALLAGDR